MTIIQQFYRAGLLLALYLSIVLLLATVLLAAAGVGTSATTFRYVGF
jgi:hypothetical protein